jgi:hypothetical protein
MLTQILPYLRRGAWHEQRQDHSAAHRLSRDEGGQGREMHEASRRIDAAAAARVETCAGGEGKTGWRDQTWLYPRLNWAVGSEIKT